MTRIEDWGGDVVETFGPMSNGRLILQCVSRAEEDEGEYTAAVLTPSMARALAADLLKFADEQEERT